MVGYPHQPITFGSLVGQVLNRWLSCDVNKARTRGIPRLRGKLLILPSIFSDSRFSPFDSFVHHELPTCEVAYCRKFCNHLE